MTCPRNGEAAGELVTPATADSEASNAILPDGGDPRKAFHKLQAQLALNAHAVYELAAGGYLVVSTRAAGACRECPDLRALAAFARQIGAAR